MREAFQQYEDAQQCKNKEHIQKLRNYMQILAIQYQAHTRSQYYQ